MFMQQYRNSIPLIPLFWPFHVFLIICLLNLPFTLFIPTPPPHFHLSPSSTLSPPSVPMSAIAKHGPHFPSLISFLHPYSTSLPNPHLPFPSPFSPLPRYRHPFPVTFHPAIFAVADVRQGLFLLSIICKIKSLSPLANAFAFYLIYGTPRGVGGKVVRVE